MKANFVATCPKACRQYSVHSHIILEVINIRKQYIFSGMAGDKQQLGATFTPLKAKRMNYPTNILQTSTTESLCLHICLKHSDCYSVNYITITWTCELFTLNQSVDLAHLEEDVDSLYYSMVYQYL